MSQPPTFQTNEFNAAYFSSATDSLTIAEGDKRYIRTGGAISVASISVGGNMLNGVESGYLTSIAAGTAQNSKALVLNSTGSISGITSLTSTTLACTTHSQGGTNYNLANMLTTSTTTNITSVGTLGSLSVSGAISSGSITTTGTNTINTYGITTGTGGLTGTIKTASQTNITSVGTLGSLNVAGSISCGILATTGFGDVNSYSLTAGLGGINGTLNTASQPNITSLGAISALCVGDNSQGSTYDLNVLSSTTASVMVGRVQSQRNAYMLEFNYVALGSTSNYLSFRPNGITTSAISLFGDGRTTIGSTSLVSTRLLVAGSSSYLSGSFERVLRCQNDNATPMAFEVQIYNEAGGSASNGVAIGTYTADPLKLMVGNSSYAYLNSSGRLMVGNTTNWSPEATIHARGEIFADNMFHSKNNVDGQAKYRFNWSQANYPALGTDVIAGAVRLGICDGSYNWVSYVPVRGGAYTNASDVRLKTDIVECPHGLEAVMNMKPRKYRMIQENTIHLGFVAQELAEIVPEAVSGEECPNDTLNEQGFPVDPMGIDLASLTSVLCKAIQEQQIQIEELKRALEVLVR
ncbi:unnamed protein product [Phytophthora lilii]|uniref:Unnamed protein product n=1 Tax=Phytophthora lilii TaxID=2077276 RepID=A0A9W7D945_9STRA|nr:unnamed protein product [Phytophthora lilii]